DFFSTQNRLHNIYRGFTHYKYYRAFKNYFFGLGINIISFGIKPHFGETGDYETLLTNEGLSPDKIFEKIRRINHVQSSEKSIWR
ncbi:hypothetical protein OK426_08765, partial [Streptococcus pneumoniae]|nr:hypothetical protein [Streptococcus pneumoniae]MDG7546831.1 hypothetical protein [Streptococcus pneumoniae]